MSSSPLKRLAGQTAVYGLSSIIGRVLNYLLVPLYTRVFVPVEYGIVTELYAYVALLIIVLVFGMETSFFRHLREGKNLNHVFGNALTWVLMMAVGFLGLILWLSPSLAGALHIGDHVEYIQWFGIIITLDAVTSLPFARLRAENKAMRFAVIKLIGIGLNIGINFFFLVLCRNAHLNPDSIWPTWLGDLYNPDFGVGYIFVANLISSAGVLLLLLPQLFRSKLGFDRKLFPKMFRYAAPMVLIGTAGIINETLDRILMEYLLPLSPEEIKGEIGIYGACYKLSIIMTLAVQAFRYAAEPFFFAEADKDNAPRTYARVMTYFTLVLSTLFVATLLYLDVVKHFIGEEFHAGLHVVPILLLANLFLGIYYNLSVWFKLTDRTLTGAWVAGGGALITIALNILWIPVYGYTGSAWATLICYASMTLGSYLLGRKYYPVPYDLTKVLGYIVLAVAVYFASTFLDIDSTAVRLLANSGLFLGFLAIVAMVEKESLVSLIKKLR